MPERKRPWWEILIGILGAVTALIIAITALLKFVREDGTQPPVPEPVEPYFVEVFWGPDNELDAGLQVKNSDKFIGWFDFKSAILETILPSVNQVPKDVDVELHEMANTENKIIAIVDNAGDIVANVWAGKDPSMNWDHDGRIRVGSPSPPIEVWATFELMSDGTYRHR